MSRRFGQEKTSEEGDEFHVLMGTIITGALLVAFVDKEFHLDERDTIVEMVEATTGGRLPAEQLLLNLDEMANFLAGVPESDWPGLFAKARGFSGQSKRLVLGMCLRMSLADGLCTGEERKMIGKIAGWMDIGERDFDLWREETAPLIAEAEASGVKFT